MILKRLFDLALALPAAFVLALPIAVVALAVRLTSPGPALYWSDRVGRHNRIFRMPKFRSMRIDTPAVATHLLPNPAQWLTPIGPFLRKSSLDELPQLLNIMRGEMSVIGPRPVTAGEMQRYGADVPFYIAVRPGVLGLWQVRGRNKLTYTQRVAYDVEYVETWSIWQDFKIILLAIPVVLLGRGAY